MFIFRGERHYCNDTYSQVSHYVAARKEYFTDRQIISNMVEWTFLIFTEDIRTNDILYRMLCMVFIYIG